MASAPQVGPVCGPPTVECDLIGRFEQLLVVYHCDLIAWIIACELVTPIIFITLIIVIL